MTSETPRTIKPFVVKHYSSEERPSIKGNGFDGLEVGSDRQSAEDFVAWVNKLIRELDASEAELEELDAIPFRPDSEDWQERYEKLCQAVRGK